MSRQSIVSHYTRLLARWPTDALRPEKSFQQLILTPRTQSPPTSPPAGVTAESITHPDTPLTYSRNESAEVNAAYLLLENSFSKQFPPGQRLMRPESNPAHYERLGRELDKLPTRGVWGNFVERVKGMVRLK